jgi:hypothetical protein
MTIIRSGQTTVLLIRLVKPVHVAHHPARDVGVVAGIGELSKMGLCKAVQSLKRNT